MSIAFNTLTKPALRFGILALSVLMAAQAFAGMATVQAAGNDTLYIAPGSGNFTVGQNFTVEVRENSNAEQVNAVQADLGYSGNLQFLSVDDTGSAFGVDAQKSGGNGAVTIARGSTTPVTGDKLVAKVNFKVLSAGNGTIEMRPSSAVVSSAENRNIVDTRSGASFGLVTTATPNPPAGPPGPPGPPGKPGPPGATPRPAPIPTRGTVPTPSPGSPPNVSIKPTPTEATPAPTPTILPDESEIEVEDPSIIETTPSEDREVEKVEYYINGKLAMTVNEPPYSYSVDSSNMRNGRYTLTTKTYYTDGKVDSTDADLVVSNALNAKQLMLQLKHYAWAVILLFLIIGGVVWFMFFRNRGGDGFGDGYGSEFAADGTGYGGDPYAPQGPQNGVAPPNDPYDPNANPGQYPPTDQYPPNNGQYPTDQFGGR